MNYKILALTFGLAGYTMATPIKTIPWNGHVGAVSFTFDDALENQVQNLKPVLDKLPDVHVTFFLTSMGDGFRKSADGFAALANAGHEMGNHTESHGHLTSISDNSELEKEIIQFAEKIEKTLADNGAKIRVISFATPFCEDNDNVKGFIAKHHFINRDCGWHGRNEWDTEPDWLSLKAKIWTRSGASVDEMLSSLDTAAFIGNFEGANPWDVQVKGGSWLVVLNHGVTDDKGDDYAIDPADIEKQFKHAIENKLWVAPFGTVGAYYRAHFIVDAAKETATDDGFTVEWEIPSEYMPASVPLRVNIDTQSVGENAIVEQGGKTIKRESDGSYVIEFTEKSLKVRKPKPGENPDSATSLPGSATRPLANFPSNTKYTLFDLNGNDLGNVNGFEVPAKFPKGTYIIRAEANGQAPLIKKVHR
ncbi:polysaccharide deacetylase family protein [Fibrobacter succinogenes]|uniref:polysaccharide deacetylase family protein n=1 Tax=Fibrobacter succinogenes TaxID=833 RepID=UPI0015689E01|nr:polysaccharide deacetylase family protein [Fibrobacter succinogenes]MBQ2561653.1 polysaccharide deacetylase family protein [Fibrobacter sp.]